MSRIMHWPGARFPKVCWGCGQRFPVRAGQAEALVGQDGRLYCHEGQPECLERAFGLGTNSGTNKAA